MTSATVTRLAFRLVPVLAVLTMAACGTEEERPAGGSGQGRLVVHKSLAAGPIFTEGSVTHVRLVNDEKVVLDALRPVGSVDIPLLDRAVPPGTYDLIAVERPCDGNCSLLDPPVATTRCRVRVIVSAGRTTRVNIVLGRESTSALSDCSAHAPRPG